MTTQRQDYLVVDGARRRLAAAAPMPFAPNAFGLRLGGSPYDDCCRGFRVDFEIDGDAFKIKTLWISPHHDDRESLLRGRLFDRAPNVADQSSMTFRDIPLSYSGKLIVDGREATVSDSPRDVHEIFRFENGHLESREIVKLQELPEEYTPSSVWIDYSSMLWILPNDSELEHP